MDLIYWIVGIIVGGTIIKNLFDYKDGVEINAERMRQAEIAQQQRELMDKRFEELINDPPRFRQYFKDKPAVMSNPDKSNVVSPTFKKITKDTSPEYNSPKKKSNDDGDFATSMAVAAITDSALLGYAAGGSVSGALTGDLLNDSNNNSYESSSDYSTSSDTSSSSYDSGSSFDSGSSGGSDY